MLFAFGSSESISSWCVSGLAPILAELSCLSFEILMHEAKWTICKVEGDGFEDPS